MTWIKTHTKGIFRYDEPDPNLVDIEDIAHALSMLCRFTGHCKSFYSVAQHSVYVSQMVPKTQALQGLLHDAAEAYVGDMNSPLKRMVSEYKEIEKKVFRAIAQQFEIPSELSLEVQQADYQILSIEARDLMDANLSEWGLQEAREDIKIVPWPPETAYRHFMDRFDALYSLHEYGLALLRASTQP